MRRPALFIALLLGMTCASVSRAGEETVQLKKAPGHELAAARCSVCHSLDYIQMNSVVMNRASWEKSIRKMIDRFGAPISDEDAKEILEYLAEHYSS